MNVKRNLVNALIVTAVAALVGFLVATIAIEPQGRFNPNVGPGAVVEIENKAHTVAGMRYVYPADLQNARKACFAAAREARGIPGGAAYNGWFEANYGNAAWANWDAAYEACKASNELPGGKWDWANMVRVSG